ncbi:MAG: SDR family oxidoreductase [Candidatus Hydrogenedentota bacterium]
MSKKVMVTGGAGFIGSNLVEKLVNDKYETIVCDNLSTGRIENLKNVMTEIKFYECDINDDKIFEIIKGVDTVFHQAAIPSVPRSVEDPITTNKANIDGTLKLLIAAREAKVRRFIFASSSSIYGDTQELPKRENMIPNPLSPYAITKLTAEHYCRVFYDLYGLETVCLRYFNIFGPKQNPESQYAAAIPKFINMVLNNVKPTVYGDGCQTRDFTFVENVVSANILAMSAISAPGKIINIGCEKAISVNELVNIIKKILKSSIEPEYLPKKPGDVRDSLSDITLAKKILNYFPATDIYEGLEKTCKYFSDIHRIANRKL